MKFSIKNFVSKCDQIHRKLWIRSHLLKKSLMENFISCTVQGFSGFCFVILDTSLGNGDNTLFQNRTKYLQPVLCPIMII